MQILPVFPGSGKVQDASHGDGRALAGANNKSPTRSGTMSVDHYYTLGRSGLRVSRLALGTMTFGTDWGWGSEEKEARAIFDRYLEAGGNFLDTADGYTGGNSERMLGKFVQESGTRDRVVIATKFTFNDASAGTRNPNSGGNQRKNVLRAVEGSL